MEFLLFCLLALTGADNIWGNAKTDQERCQAEAEYMAEHDIKDHVAGVIGNFEGVGWSTGPCPPTCTPKWWKRMRLTGDAIVKGKNNTYYRVRSWR
jgi:hypothetical protein